MSEQPTKSEEIPAGATPVAVPTPAPATQIVEADPVRAAFQQFRAWFLKAERDFGPRLCIDRTIEKLGELCGDPPLGA